MHDNKLQVIDCKLHIIVHLSVNTSCDNNPIITTIYKNQYIPSFCVDYYYVMCVLCHLGHGMNEDVHENMLHATSRYIQALVIDKLLLVP